MKGGDLIAEFLIREKIDHVFGICGHGNVGMLDALHGVRDRVRLAAPNGMGCIPMAHRLSLGFIGRNGAYLAARQAAASGTERTP